MLNDSKGDMYDFITHTWNPIKGACRHDCSYCFMKRWGKLNPVRLDEKEFKTNLGLDNYIFVGSSCDMFASDIPQEWILKVFNYCKDFEDFFFFQTKNPARFLELEDHMFRSWDLCTTIETNRFYPEIMGNSPTPKDRALAMSKVKNDCFVTIEPIIDFDAKEMVDLIQMCNPVQVNIGANTSNAKLPEPSKEKVLELIERIKTFTIVNNKKNLKRILA